MELSHPVLARRGVPHPVLARRGGVLHPVLAGLGYPIPGPGGRGTPSSPCRWVPHPFLARGYPRIPPLHPDLGWATPHQLDGVPPCLDLGWGTPHQLDGYPPAWTWDGVTPSVQTWDGVPPPSVEEWTDKQTENSTFPHPSDAGGNYKQQQESPRVCTTRAVSCPWHILSRVGVGCTLS